MVTVDITGHPGNMTDVRKSKLMRKKVKKAELSPLDLQDMKISHFIISLT